MEFGGSSHRRSDGLSSSKTNMASSSPSSNSRGWLQGLMSSTVDSLAVERVGEQFLGNLQPHVSILGSASPITDGTTLLWLFPHKFRQEQFPEAVLLIDRAGEQQPNSNRGADNSSSSSEGGLTLLLLQVQQDASDRPLQAWKNAALLCEEHEITHACHRSRQRPSCSVIHQETMDVRRGVSTTLAVLRLSGGGNLLLMTPALIKSSIGRAALLDFCLSRERIEAMENVSHHGRDSGALEHAPTTENLWLDELEGEFSSRLQQRRRSSVGGASLHRAAGAASVATSVCSVHEPFPNLSLFLQRKHGFWQQNVEINSREAMSFETDLFAGRMVLLLKPVRREDDTYHDDLLEENEKSLFMLQIQGHFKYVPQGTVYAGLELACDEPDGASPQEIPVFKPALLTKALCRAILKAVMEKHKNVSYSFGEKHANKSGIRPHLLAPAWSFFDRIVSTRPHSTPPTIDEPLYEPMGSVNARMQSGSRGAWNTKDTYSFCAMSPHLDLAHWHLRNLAGIVGHEDTVDLTRLLGDLALRLVLFEQHATASNYLFVLQISYKTKPDEDDFDVDMEFEEPEEKLDEDYDLSELFERADEAVACFHEDYDDNDDDLLPFARPTSLPSGEVLETANICPAWIEVIAEDGLFRKVFGFCPKGCERMILRTVADVKKCVDLESAIAVVDGDCSPRISVAERTRRVLGFALGCNSTLTLPVRQFISATNDYDRNFLAQPSSRMKRSSRTKSVYVARMISEFHWREEVMTLWDRVLEFQHPDKDEADFSLDLSSLLGVRQVDNRSNDIVGFYVVELETLGRVVRLLFASPNDREYWVKKIKDGISSSLDSPEMLEHIIDPWSHFLHESTMWLSRGQKKRRILNCRRLTFPATVKNMSNFEASALVEDSILLGYEAQERQAEDVLVQFLDSVARLKMVDVYQFEEQRDLTTFFLNIFHLMIIHSNLLLGPPASEEDFVDRMHTMCYQLSDDVFSLAELEHNILKGNVPFPTTYHPSYTLPKSAYPFAVKTLDFRVHFALNVGSVLTNEDEQSDSDASATFPSVPIYNSEILDSQLEATTAAFLEVVSIERRMENPQFLVTLPQVCKWYAREMGGPNLIRLLDTLFDFLSEHNRMFINSFKELEEEPFERVGIKYIPYSYVFQDLKVEDSRVRKRLSRLDGPSVRLDALNSSRGHLLDGSSRSAGRQESSDRSTGRLEGSGRSRRLEGSGRSSRSGSGARSAIHRYDETM